MKQLKPLPMVRRRWSFLSGSRAWIAGLGLAGVLLLGLILRDTIFSSAQTATTPRLATVTRGTVQSQVSGTGSLVPSAQYNLGFRTAGQLTEVDVRVGQTVKAGQVLARIDPSAAQASLAQAQASLQSAQAGLQSANAPLTAAQRLQLQHQLSAAQQNYNDTVASVNQTNQADATAVANDQAKVSADCPAGAQCSADKAQLASDQQRQKTDQVSGNSRIHQAQQQINSASDNLAIQSQVKSQAVSSAQAQVASAQAQVSSAQQAVSQTTLTAPANGVVISINGVPGEYVGTGGGTTAEAPGSLAPAPSTSSASGSGGSSAFMVIQDTSSFVSVVPFAETDAAKLQAQQPASVTFDAIPNLTISATVLQVAPGATVVSNVVNYYATIVLNRSDPRLKAGMTANATVTVSQQLNVLYVPNSAIQNTGGTPSVLVYANGQQVSREVTEGLVGDTNTEITGGLNEGERVVLPSLRTTTGAGTTTRTGGGGLFLGGGRGAGG